MIVVCRAARDTRTEGLHGVGCTTRRGDANEIKKRGTPLGGCLPLPTETHAEEIHGRAISSGLTPIPWRCSTRCGWWFLCCIRRVITCNSKSEVQAPGAAAGPCTKVRPQQRFEGGRGGVARFPHSYRGHACGCACGRAKGTKGTTQRIPSGRRLRVEGLLVNGLRAAGCGLWVTYWRRRSKRAHRRSSPSASDVTTCSRHRYLALNGCKVGAVQCWVWRSTRGFSLRWGA